MVIIPKNYTLLSVNVFVAITQSIQLFRALRFKYESRNKSSGIEVQSSTAWRGSHRFYQRVTPNKPIIFLFKATQVDEFEADEVIESD